MAARGSSVRRHQPLQFLEPVLDDDKLWARGFTTLYIFLGRCDDKEATGEQGRHWGHNVAFHQAG